MIRRFTALLTFALAAGSIPAIAAHAVEPPPIVDPVGRIEGTITDAESGAPIAGACVQLHLGERSVAKVCAGADGGYAFTDAWAGIGLQLVATAAGYPARWWPDRLDRDLGGSLPLTAGEVKRADFAMSEVVGTIEGRFTDHDGVARPYTEALLYRTSESGPMATITADADGRFRREDIPPGGYHLYVGSQWHPRQTDRASAATITIAAGGPARVDEQLFYSCCIGRATMAGQVKDSAGAAVAGATVTVAHGQRTLAEVVTDAQGRYAIPGLPTFALYSVIARHGTRVTWAPQNPTPRPNTFDPAKPVDIVMPANPSTVRGTIRDFDGTPIPRGSLTLSKPGVAPASVPISPDGTFEIPNVLPGTYQARIALSGRGTFSYPFVDPAASPSIVIDGGETEVLNATSMRPSYVEMTARDEDTGEPIAGLCHHPGFATTLPCTGPDGVALVGPYWVLPGTSTVTVFMSHSPYYFYAQKPAPIRQGETTTAEATYRRGATLEIPIAGSAPPASGQICVSFAPLGFDIGGRSECTTPQQGVLRLGPYENETTRLFLDPEDNASGAQWLGSDGGKGRQKEAMTVTLERRRVTVTPPARFEPAGSISGTITPQGGGTSQADGCAFAGKTGHCGWWGTYAVEGLGPYDWEVRYSMDGRATAWSGGAPDRTRAGTVKVVSGRSTVANLSLPVQATMVFPEGQSFEVFDAGSGDRLYSAPLGLNSGQVVLRYTAADGKSCWLTRPLLGRQSYYFPVRAGRATTIAAKAEPGVNCVATAPALIRTVVWPNRYAPERLPLGAVVHQELLRLFP